MALGFADFTAMKKRAVRAPLNPLDICTLINIFPKPFHEEKLTLQPSVYHIDAGSYENPSILLITSASWWRDVGNDEPLLEMVHGSPVMAESIVKDALIGMFGVTMPSAMPGLFWLPGSVTKNELITKYKVHMDTARVAQNHYYQNLVKQADGLWARTNGNPLAIPETAKLAASELQLDRPWKAAIIAQEIVRCVACGSNRNANFPVCPNCKAIVDVELAKKHNIKFAE